MKENLGLIRILYRCIMPIRRVRLRNLPGGIELPYFGSHAGNIIRSNR